jgi:hypothetical protein
MKLARSNLLGELVDASVVEHADTHGFQIVCPCCDESVFKVRRPLKDGRMSEFFSHRQTGILTIADCEMRVASISSETSEAHNAAARGQTMAMFNSHLRKALSLEAWCYGKNGPRLVHEKMQARIGMQLLTRYLWDEHRRLGVENVFDDELSQTEKFLERECLRPRTTFGEAVQKRVMKDMFRHLLTEQGRANHAWLCRHTSLRMFGVSTATEIAYGRSAYPEHIHLYLKAMHVKNPLLAKETANKATQASNKVGDSDGFYRVMTMNMLIDLMRVPYAEMLANHRLGRQVLDGLNPRTRPDAIMGGMLTEDERKVRSAQLMLRSDDLDQQSGRSMGMGR